ncbi:Plasmodium vivax Vir protein, putative [Plasmodium vivax]|uniref:Vir protein, putative n=1 Tax=Plasmodium vivax TaxID=5855 RepID=A0A1G4EDN9_PLAVI|nr:Plasmodium vivax Vir protein, putative [Plasmodium vivax]
MTRDQRKKEEDYDFFEKINRYIRDGKPIEDNIQFDKLSTDCNSFSEIWGKKIGNSEMAKNMCNIFINMYKELKKGKNNYTLDSEYNNDFAFLNYWVNWKIHEGGINESNPVTDFYNHIGSHAPSELILEFTNNLIYDINKDYLNKMNTLYNLYDNYSKLNAIDYAKTDQVKQQLLTLSTASCTHYNKAKYICNEDNRKNNLKFCDKLEAFESKYKDLYQIVDTKPSEISNNFIKLAECPNTKIIASSVIGSIVGLIPLFGVLYKFTPMGQVLRSKMGIINNDINNTEEDMTNISLMEQEKEPLKFQKGIYNIKYQSL